MAVKLYVQYGCGLGCPEGWLNFDSSPTLRLERLPLIGGAIAKRAVGFPAGVRYGDILKGLPVAPGAVDGLYASHVLEHLSFEDGLAALRQSFRLLKPGGVFRIVVPDLESRARYYVARRDAGDAQANAAFLDGTLLGFRRRARGLSGVLRAMFGSSAHLWMWDAAALEAALKEAGFTAIRRCAFRDSGDPMFDAAEEESRFFWSPEDDSGDAPGDASGNAPARRFPECALEARKP
ncbi:MAG: methyltransferase domain-containing protein [Rhodospirillales bacterium]